MRASFFRLFFIWIPLSVDKAQAYTIAVPVHRVTSTRRLTSEMVADLNLSRILGPIERSAIVMNIPYIKSGSPFQEHPDDAEMTG